jgi:antitoxin component YwqK of YwqJK toxin-antitoxin module
MRAFLAFLALLLLPLPGCGPEGDDGPNSRDFGPQPWPGPCRADEYKNGELIRENMYYWEDGLLVKRQLVGQTSCSKYYYREDRRLETIVAERPCGQKKDSLQEYEWNENGQLSSIDYTSYDTDGSALISRSRTIHTYGPNDELTEKLSQEQDLDTGEWKDYGFTRYFYDDLGRLVRVETWDIEGGVEELSRADDFLYEGDASGYHQRNRDSDGDGIVDWVNLMTYDENGLWVKTATDDGSIWWERHYNESGMLMKEKTHHPDGDDLEYFYAYDCWE